MSDSDQDKDSGYNMGAKELIRAPNNVGKFDTIYADKTGRVVAVNKRRLYEMPFFLGTNPPNTDVAIGGVGAASSNIAMRVSAEGPMQLLMLGAVRDATHAACLVRMYMRDGADVGMLMNVPMHIDNIFGHAGLMYPLPEGLYVDENRALSVTFQSLAGAVATAGRIVAVGAKYSQLQLDPQLQRVKERMNKSQFLSTPFFYGLDATQAALTAYATTQFEITISNAHNFEIHQLSYVSTGTFNIDIVDVTKGESIINAPRSAHYGVPSLLWFGNGSYPYRFHEPIMVFGGQRLLVTLTDTSGLKSGNTVYLALGGKAVKVRTWS